MPRKASVINADKCGWRVSEWADDVGLGPSFVYELIRDRRIQSVKLAGARIITTPPSKFLANLADQGNDL